MSDSQKEVKKSTNKQLEKAEAGAISNSYWDEKKSSKAKKMAVIGVGIYITIEIQFFK